jgi:hypothetical protein
LSGVVVALVAVLGERRLPRPLPDFEDRGADRLGQIEADREAHVRVVAAVQQFVRSAG